MGEELGDGILIVQLRMGRDELAVGGGKDDGFSVFYLKEELKWNYLVGFGFMIGAVFFVFKKW